MLSRRQFLSSCACGICAAALPASAQDQAVDNVFFYCGTPQLTDVYLRILELNATPGTIGIGDLNSAPKPTGIELYGTAQRALRWTAQQAGKQVDGKPVVPISFTDGTSAQKQKVIDIASTWLTKGVPVAFEFVSSPSQGKVRISFSGGTNQSAVGNDALAARYSGGATMRLPELARPSNESAIRRAVLHEFGHGIMTFGHEHRHPDAGYQFKDSATIASLINATLPAGTSQWTTSMVETNITNPPYGANRACTAYDRESIMHYPVQSSWLRAGSPVPRPADTLSDLDVDCAIAVYS